MFTSRHSRSGAFVLAFSPAALLLSAVACRSSPPSGNLLPVQVRTVVTTTDGTPVPDELVLALRVPSLGTNYGTLATPDEAGDVEFALTAKSRHLHERDVVIAVRDARCHSSREDASHFTLDTTHELAAVLPDRRLRLDPEFDVYVTCCEVELARPPRYGTLVITAPPQGGSTIEIADAPDTGEDAGSWFSPGFAAACPTRIGEYPVFRWSVRDESEVRVRGPEGVLTFRGRLKRGASLELTPAREVPFELAVDQSTRPTAFRVMLVRAADHAPDHDAASGSRVTYHEQFRRALVGVRVAFDDGAFRARVACTDEALVAELWELATDADGNARKRLAAWRTIPAHTDGATVRF